MAFVQFRDVSFFYPKMDLEVQSEAVRAIEAPEQVNQVFQHLSIDIPEGVVSLVGENGIGKTTFLLLAGARLFPADGAVHVSGIDTADFHSASENPEVEQRRNELVSFVYQNMEFETEDSIGDLMEFIHESGNRGGKRDGLVGELRTVLELEGVLGKKLQSLSKGQMQRSIIAFSLLYGSPLVIMDEPVFALEEPQKERVFEFLMDFSKRYGTSVYYSAHNLELTRKYSSTMLLFNKNGAPEIGPTEEMYTRDRIEAAYQVPMDALYRRENLFREMLVSMSRRPPRE